MAWLPSKSSPSIDIYRLLPLPRACGGCWRLGIPERHAPDVDWSVINDAPNSLVSFDGWFALWSAGRWRDLRSIPIVFVECFVIDLRLGATVSRQELRAINGSTDALDTVAAGRSRWLMAGLLAGLSRGGQPMDRQPITSDPPELRWITGWVDGRARNMSAP